MAKYLTAPDPNETGWPKGVKYIIGNEGCERFSFYGMKSILQVHLTALFVMGGMYKDIGSENAQEMVHLFVAGVYAFPMIGAIVADRLLGKYHTIIWLSLVYCLGHFVLAIGENSIGGMWLGLGLIAIGSGGIKPCVSAHVGDQFGKGNWRLVDKVFQAFYFIINFGSFFSTIMIPWVKEEIGTSVAFGIPGVLMFIATIMFWMGRKVFVHVPPHPGGRTGLLDALGSTLLFMGFIGLPMFGWGVLSFSANVFLTVSSILIGLWVFEERQAIEQDDGFLAVMFRSVESLLKGGGPKDLDASVPADSMKRHWFFGAAADKFGEEAAEGPKAVLKIISVFFLISVFWALFDQHASSWVRQAEMMDLNMYAPWTTTIPEGEFDEVNGAVVVEVTEAKETVVRPILMTLYASQISALNPLMVMALIPFNMFFLYPFITKRGWEMTPLRKMTIGMATASIAFVVVALIQARIEAAETANSVSVLWQFFPYLIMTQAEVMVSITGLEFAYTQAPTRMKSTIMGFWLLSVSLGNVLVAAVTKAQGWLLPLFTTVDPETGPTLTQFFWFFAGFMAAAALLFGLRSAFYKYRYYTQ